MEKVIKNRGEKSFFYRKPAIIMARHDPTPTHTPEEIELIKDHIENFDPDPIRQIKKGKIALACRQLRNLIWA